MEWTTKCQVCGGETKGLIGREELKVVPKPPHASAEVTHYLPICFSCAEEDEEVTLVEEV